ncbi:MAG: hypothetical protein ABS939_00420 [Psychrobacillus sp.]
MIKIGEKESEVIEWNHLDAMQGRLGLISKETNHAFMQYLKKSFTELNGIVMQITTEKKDAETEDYLSITDFEGMPTEDPDSIFGTVRMNWVQQYLNLLAYIHKRDRFSFIPSASYRAHSEGPLMGYVRAVEELNDSADKELLLKHFEKLEKVKWFRSEEEGFVYEVIGETEEELLESIFIGAWSLWTFVNTVEAANPLNIMLELSGSLMEFPVLNEKREFISFAVSSISRLSFDYLVSVVIKSSSLFPMPESIIEHYIIEDNEAPDMDWSESYPAINDLGEDIVIWKCSEGYEEMKIVLAKENSV